MQYRDWKTLRKSEEVFGVSVLGGIWHICNVLTVGRQPPVRRAANSRIYFPQLVHTRIPA